MCTGRPPQTWQANTVKAQQWTGAKQKGGQSAFGIQSTIDVHGVCTDALSHNGNAGGVESNMFEGAANNISKPPNWMYNQI